MDALFCCRGSFFLLACLVFIGAGCRPAQQGTPGILGLPPENKARIVSHQVSRTGQALHWKWSLIGERNWMEASNAGGGVSLQKTVALNDADMKGGTNVWEVDLIAKVAGKEIRWTTRLHGSNGMTRDDSGAAPGDLRAVQIALERDTLASLPADLTLARIGNQEIKWRLAR